MPIDIEQKRTVKRKILIRTYGLLAFIVIGVWAASSYYVVSDQRYDEKQQARSMAVFLGDQVDRMNLWDDHAALQTYLTDITESHPTFEYIFVTRNGVPIASTIDGDVPGDIIDADGSVSETGRVVTRRTPDGHVLFDAAAAIAGDGRMIHVGSPRGALDPYVATTLKSIAVSSTIALLLGFGLAWMVSTLTDRELEQSERALRESEARHRLLFDQAPDSIMLMALVDGQAPVIFEANKATETMHGLTREEVIGRPITQLDSPDDRKNVNERVRRIMDGEMITFEGEHVRKDGSRFPVEVIARMVEVDGRPVIQAIDRDISDRKQAEEEKAHLEAQLLQAQKMEAIGQLAGGIAHDMNNVLGAIMGSASLMEDLIEPGSSEREWLDNILAASKRGRDITRNFLGYARKGRFVKERVCLNDLVMETTDLLRHTIAKTVAVEVDLDPDIGCIVGDRGLINQALMNVCINAVDAIGDQGTLRIATETEQIEDSGPKPLDGPEPGWYSKVSVSDTGCGMDDETLNKALEPFFTTKSASEGTGLGLSMVHGTVVSHGGAVTIESAPGRGTTITLLFPKSDLDLSIAGQPLEAFGVVPRTGEGRVLLVDDEKLLRFVAKQMLERQGYEVEVAADGREAVELYTRSRDEIDLVVLDLVMPEMDGPETFRRLIEIDPDVRVLIASGFTNDETVEELVAAGAIGFVEKPFDKEGLGAAVAQALG